MSVEINKYYDIPEYEGKYQVNFNGQVRRTYKSGKVRLLTPYKKPMKGSKRLIVKLTKDGKSKEIILMQIVAKTFLGECPKGYVSYHKNGMQSDNTVNNIAYISKQQLGKLTGASSRRQPVVKLDNTGQAVAFYTSAREAAKQNYMSYQTVMDRCNGQVKKAFAPDGYEYAWEDSEVSTKHALRRIQLANKYMPKAREIMFDF